jgi:D-inositol-3-phosphate glycosyltransferase
MGSGLVGLVRVVDPRGRGHIYGVGSVPEGRLVGELGALRADPSEGSIPVWVTERGQVATPQHRPRAGVPGVRATVGWVLDPARWSDTAARSTRARAVGRRLLLALGRLAVPRRSQPAPAGEPFGYLDPPDAAGGAPLFASIHPVTGDQLLTTDRREAAQLGYGDPALIGRLLAMAPATASLGRWDASIPWATRFGKGRLAANLRGAIDSPSAGTTISRESFNVRGWALLGERTSVGRVDVYLDGVLAGRARLGLARPDVLEHAPSSQGHPEAAICGFELAVAPTRLAPDRREVTVRVEVRGTDGSIYEPPPATVWLEPPAPPFRDVDGRARQLRERVQRVPRGKRATGNAPISLLAFTHRLDYGGAQRYFFELLRRLSTDPGFSCAVVARQEGPHVAELEAVGIPVHVTEYPVASPDHYEAQMLELAAWARDRPFNVVFANALDSFIGVDLASRLGLPAIWAIHESFDLPVWWTTVYGAGEVHPYVRERGEHALASAMALVFAADSTRKMFEHYGRAGASMTLPYGMELEEMTRHRSRVDRTALRRSHGIADSTTTVLCLGTVEPRKCQALLLRAFAGIADRHPDAMLLVVGDRDGPYSQGIHHYVDQMGLRERVKIVPVVADAYEWHSLADVFVLPSDVESSPLVLIEAMTFETPVVATRVFGVPELVEEGHTGYLCESNDVDSLASAMDRVLALDASKRAELGRAAREAVLGRHSGDAYAEKMRTLLKELLQDAAGLEQVPPRRNPARVDLGLSG